MPQKVVVTQYPLIDADPHASRVIKYFRPSDYASWAIGTAGFPGLLYLWEKVDRTGLYQKTAYKTAGWLGFVGGFLFAYQRSSMRFWGWSENAREQARDLAELSQLAKEGKPLYGTSDQPAWVQSAAYGNSIFSQLKFSAMPWFNLVNHPYHGTDPAKYAPQATQASGSPEGETS